jgi:hypothetical protein
MSYSRIPTIVAASVAAAAIAVGAAGTAAAQGGGGGGVRATGSCSAGSAWHVKAKPDDGRIQLEVEIDTHRVGQTWTVAITDNATRIFTGKRVTSAPSGSFSVELRTANRAGTDRFVSTTRNLRTGETCMGRVFL